MEIATLSFNPFNRSIRHSDFEPCFSEGLKLSNTYENSARVLRPDFIPTSQIPVPENVRNADFALRTIDIVLAMALLEQECRSIGMAAELKVYICRNSMETSRREETWRRREAVSLKRLRMWRGRNGVGDEEDIDYVGLSLVNLKPELYQVEHILSQK